MMHHQYPEEVQTAWRERALRAVGRIGIDTRLCPHCGGALSYDLNGHPFCRGCHRKAKRQIMKWRAAS